jgi:hypothetical protein
MNMHFTVHARTYNYCTIAHKRILCTVVSLSKRAKSTSPPSVTFYLEMYLSKFDSKLLREFVLECLYVNVDASHLAL